MSVERPPDIPSGYGDDGEMSATNWMSGMDPLAAGVAVVISQGGNVVAEVAGHGPF